MDNNFPDPDGEEPEDIFDDFDLSDDEELSVVEFANLWTDLCNQACYD
jgi:hypothetical protein